MAWQLVECGHAIDSAEIPEAENTPWARQLVRGSAIKQPCEPVPVTHAPEGHRPGAERRVHRSAARLSAAKASTPCGDELIPWCLQRADTAQSLYSSYRVLARRKRDETESGTQAKAGRDGKAGRVRY